MIEVLSKRKRFFWGHLGISFVIGLIVLLWLLMIWYPMPLAKATGVTHIIIMMLLIDVVIGPILGLLIYKEHKKSLKFDIAIIILIQVSAFVYGFYSISQGRPVYIVYVVDRFELVKNNEILKNNINEAQSQFQSPSLGYPQFVGTENSINIDQRNNDMFEEALAGISVAQKPERYVDLSKVYSKIQQSGLSFKDLEKYNSKDSIDKVLKKYPQANGWLPLKASAVDMVVLINKESAEVVKIVDLRPWN